MEQCASCGKELPGAFPFCPFCGAPLSPGAPARERKVVSVVFCDLVGFTAASEAADPEEVQARMAPYLARTRERLEAYGGTVEKFIGDAVMAVFGAPVAHEDDAERAVRAGLAVLEAIDDLNAADASLALSVRIGVSTGEAVVELNARPALGQGMVTGDVVNTAARIQSQAPVDGVAVGEGTYEATERVFAFEPLGPITAKGKAGPVRIWRALAPRARLGSDVMRTMSAPFVGRGIDLALLTGMFDKAAGERAVQMVTVVGEPGVGKSRLVAELGAYADGLSRLVTWRQGRCLPYGDGITFWALGEILKAHAGIYESDAPEVAIAKLDAAVPESDDRPWVRARLLPLIGIDGGGVVDRGELFTAWQRFLESIAERDPFVLVIEDIHWADEAMLAFIEHLADWAHGVPLLIVCTARPELYETRPAWGAGLANQTAIRLSPLSDDETASLVASLLEQIALPPETRELLLARAGGNPLYAEEFVRMLRDRDLLDDDGLLRPGAGVQVPGSLQAMIAARLDTLAPARKLLLQDAAVMGKVFWSGSLVAMGERDAREVELALHELARKELVRPARQSAMQGEAEYAFWHLLVADVVYAQIPRRERAAKHASAAAWLEAKARDRLEDMAEVLAYHTGEALSLADASGDDALRERLAPAAARYALLAGERALGLDTHKALSLFERARALTPAGDPSAPLVLLRWGEAVRHAGRLTDAAAAFEEAAERLERSGDAEHASEALANLGSVRGRNGEAGVLEVLEHAVALLEPFPLLGLVDATTEIALYHYVYGHTDEALAVSEQALALARELGLAVPARALGCRGVARCEKGDLGGLADVEQALALLTAGGSGRAVAVLQHNLAVVRWMLEGPLPASRQYGRAEQFAASRGLTEAAQSSATWAAIASYFAGSADAALARIDELLPSLERSGERSARSSLFSVRTIILAERGVLSLETAEEALLRARSNAVPLVDAYAVLAAAPALIADGQTERVRELVGEVVAGAHLSVPDWACVMLPLARVAQSLGDADLAGRLAAGVPETSPIQEHALAGTRALQAEMTGDPGAAAGLYSGAAERFEGFTAAVEQAYALLGEGRCRENLGEPGASAVLARARALFAQMGCTRRVDECDELLARSGGPEQLA